MAIHTLHERAPAQTGEDGLSWRVYSTPEQLEEIAGAWDELLASSPCNRTFNSREWYMASSTRLDSWSPYVVAAFRGEKTICILALVIDSKDKTIKFAHHSRSDYNDAVSRTVAPNLLADLLSYALANAQDCRRMVLSRLRTDSLCAQAIPFLRIRSQFNCDWREIECYRRVCLPETFDSYLNSRSKTFREDIRRSFRDLAKNGLTLRELDPNTFPASSIPELLITLCVARHGDRCSFIQTPYMEAFPRNVLPPLFRKGYMRAFALLEGERVLGLDLCAVSPYGLATWNGGFVPEIKRYSPGTALFAFGIQQAIVSGLREFDFMQGPQAYKSNWTNNDYPMNELELSF
ncbi:MAG TPA: GNAT family N-acetyltransferase [Candidatus Angelobacter sp.]|nr:GNAT family N-acetyltransferase [Candidatus Angelobacter sp.]